MPQDMPPVGGYGDVQYKVGLRSFLLLFLFLYFEVLRIRPGRGLCARARERERERPPDDDDDDHHHHHHWGAERHDASGPLKEGLGTERTFYGTGEKRRKMDWTLRDGQEAGGWVSDKNVCPGFCAQACVKEEEKTGEKRQNCSWVEWRCRQCGHGLYQAQ